MAMIIVYGCIGVKGICAYRGWRRSNIGALLSGYIIIYFYSE